MSSTGSFSDIKKPKRSGEFILTWSIHNYSYCTKKEAEYFDSPYFVVENANWWLSIYPKGNDEPGFLSCYLNRGHDGYKGNCKFSFSIQKSDEQFQEEEEAIYNFSSYGYANGRSKFVSLEKLKQSDSGYLDNDILTIRCRIWKTDSYIPESVKCDIFSKIQISKLNYAWILNDIEVSSNMFLYKFNQTNDITDCFEGVPSLKIHVLNGGHSGEDAIHFGIEMGQRSIENFYFFICVIHLLDSHGRIAHSARAEHLFEHSKPTENWNFPIISKNKLYLNKNVYLPKGRLSLNCEFSFASDNRLETFEYRRTYIEKKPDVLEPDPDRPGLWIENMQECFLGGKFSDFIIRTPNKQFPVHKGILSAHSEVFSAMFERDMKENNCGFVEIEDLEVATVSQMLMFLYTNTIRDLNCTSAQKLYFAADKYKIKPLQEKCSNHLMSGLDASNVCDILGLADRHQDEELKMAARRYIDAHTCEIIASEGWKKLIETNPHLTTDVLQSIVCNRLLCK